MHHQSTHLPLFKMTDQQKEDIMIDELMMKAIEEEAAKLEITVDYYMEEFM